MTDQASPGETRVIGVAVAIPEPYGSHLQAIRARLGDPQADSIPTHITLLPPTTVDASLVTEIYEHLAAVAAAQRPYPIVLQGSGTFRPVSPVVFVNLVEGSSACERLESAVRSGVLWRPIHFNYHPHVTVAHDVPDDALDAARDELADYSAAFRVDHFTVYEHVDGVWIPRRNFHFPEGMPDSPEEEPG